MLLAEGWLSDSGAIFFSLGQNRLKILRSHGIFCHHLRKYIANAIRELISLNNCFVNTLVGGGFNQMILLSITI